MSYCFLAAQKPTGFNLKSSTAPSSVLAIRVPDRLKVCTRIYVIPVSGHPVKVSASRVNVIIGSLMNTFFAFCRSVYFVPRLVKMVESFEIKRIIESRPKFAISFPRHSPYIRLIGGGGGGGGGGMGAVEFFLPQAKNNRTSTVNSFCTSLKIIWKGEK